MKTKLFKDLLERFGIIKGGYLNPMVMGLFVLLFISIPFITKLIYYDDIAEREYLKDEELVELILTEYSDLEGSGEELVLVEEEKEEEKVKEAEVPIIRRQKIDEDREVEKVVIEQKKKSANNLTRLLQKAKRDKGNLTKWDHFRLRVYKTALNLKNRYPEIDGAPEDIYLWSMKTFHQESRYNGKASNPHSSARGIFQAMAATRKALKMPSNLSEFEQVAYYEKYIIMQIEGQRLKAENLNSALDWYMITFYPALSDKSDNATFAKCNSYSKWACRKGWKHCNYHANQGYDLDKNCVITKGEIGNHLMRPKK